MPSARYMSGPVDVNKAVSARIVSATAVSARSAQTKPGLPVKYSLLAAASLVARMMLFPLGQNFALPASRRMRPWQARNGRYWVVVVESLATAATPRLAGRRSARVSAVV